MSASFYFQSVYRLQSCLPSPHDSLRSFLEFSVERKSLFKVQAFVWLDCKKLLLVLLPIHSNNILKVTYIKPI